MATRIKMLKLLQEVQEMNGFSTRQPPPRIGALVLPIRTSAPKKPKHIVRISIQEPPDIPAPVKIVFLQAPSAPI